MMKAKSAAVDRKRGGQPPSGRNVAKPLKGKKLFLHLQGYRAAVRVEQDLSLLGGTIEKCFSRDVDYVVTSQGVPSDYEKKKTGAAMTNPSPITPSPFNLANMGIDSPQGNSPSTFEPKKPLTRGKAMAQAAKSTKLYGTMDVIEAARTWKLKIIHVDRALNWIKREIERLPATARNKAGDTTKREMKVKKLKGTYVKFEANNRGYRPVYQELKSMPEIHLGSPPWTCPFNKGKQNSRIDERGEGEEERDPQGMPDELLALDDDSPGAAAKKGQPAKEKADHTEELFGSPILTAGEVRHMVQERKRAEMKRGYCEVCQVKYENIDQHVRNNRHRDFVGNNNNYIVLDKIIASGPNMTQFIDDVVYRLNLAADAVFDMSNDEVLLLRAFPSPVASGNKRKASLRTQSTQEKPAVGSVKDKKMLTKKKTPTKQVPALAGRSPLRKNLDRGTPSSRVAKPPIRQVTPRTPRTRKPSESGTQSPAKPLDKTPNTLETIGSPDNTKGSPAKPQRTPSKRAAKGSRDDKDQPQTVVEQQSPRVTQDCRASRSRLAAGLQDPLEKEVHKPSNLEVDHKDGSERESVPKAESAVLVPSTPEGTTFLKASLKGRASDSKSDGVRSRRSARLSQDGSQEKTVEEKEEKPVEDYIEDVGDDNQPEDSLDVDQTGTQQADKEPSDDREKAVSQQNHSRVLRLSANCEDVTPRTALALKHILNHESEALVVCSPLNMQQVKHCQDTVTESVSVSSLLGYNMTKTQTETSQEDIDSGPVRRVRSSQRSRSRNNSQSTRSVSQSLGTASQSTEPDSERQSRSTSRQCQAEPSKCNEAPVKVAPKANIRWTETSNSPADNEEKENVRHRRSRVSKSDTKSKASTKCPAGEKPSTPKKTGHNKPRGILTPTDVSKTSTPTQSGGSKRRIRLKKKWSLTTDRSMRKILHSGSDADFEGFTDDSNIPSDTSYEDVSEVEVEEHSEVEWVISGASASPAGSTVGVISHGLDRSRSPPPPDSTGVTPIKLIAGNVSQIMSEGSSTGWDDNLEDFLDGQVKQKSKEDKNTSGLYTSLLVQVGSPRRSPRKNPRKSPFKFVASPLGKVTTPKRVASPARRSPRKHTPQTANRTLDFATPNFSMLEGFGEYEDLWVGPTKNERFNLSYTQKVKEGKPTTPGQRTPIYQQAGKLSQMTPVSTRPLPSSSQSGASTSKSSCNLILNKSKSLALGSSPKPSTSHSGGQPKQGSTPTCKVTVKHSSETQPTTPKVRRQVDDEVQFYMSSPGTQIEDTIRKMSVPSPITPMEKTAEPKRLLVGKLDDLPGVATKRCTPAVYDWDEEDEIEAPQKKIFKSLSSTKKQVSLGHMPAFEFKAVTSLKHKTPESTTKSAGRTPDVRLSDLGRSVTPLAKSRTPVSSKRGNSISKVKSPLTTLTEETIATSTSAVKSATSTVVQKVTTETLPQSRQRTPRSLTRQLLQTATSSTPNGSGITVKTTKVTPVTRNIPVVAQSSPRQGPIGNKDRSGERTPTASTASTPKTPTCDKLDKVLSLHSLENIQFSPRRKSSNVASIVRFHYDSDTDDDWEESEVEDRGSKPDTSMISKPATPKTVSKEEPSKLSRSAPSKGRSSCTRSTKNLSKRVSPLNKSADKGTYWSKAKVKSPRRSISRLPHTTFKSKNVDWSTGLKRSGSRRASAACLLKRVSLTNEDVNRAKSSSHNARRSLQSVSISPLRKRLRMEASPHRNSLHLKPISSTKQRPTSQRDRLGRSVKNAVNYNETGSDEDVNRAKSSSHNARRSLQSVSISPLRKRLRMEASPHRNSLHLKPISSTKQRPTSQRDRLGRSVKNAVNYNEAGSNENL